MAAPQPPIIMLHEGDDAVAAFLTTTEAVDHLSRSHNLAEHDLADWNFFDARGRRLSVVSGPDGALQDFTIASEGDETDQVRQRVRRRSGHARQVLERQRDAFERVDESPLTLTDESVAFEIFAWRLACALRPEQNPLDPVPKTPGPEDVRGWWHNTFSH